MKCNKCLKTIPEGEEVKFQGKRYDSGNHYGGCYCEECWKKSDFYQFFENEGKSPKPKVPGSGIFIIFLLLTIFVFFIYWWKKKNNE